MLGVVWEEGERELLEDEDEEEEEDEGEKGPLLLLGPELVGD
jgi:hypothetical protein